MPRKAKGPRGWHRGASKAPSSALNHTASAPTLQLFGAQSPSSAELRSGETLRLLYPGRRFGSARCIAAWSTLLLLEDLAASGEGPIELEALLTVLRGRGFSTSTAKRTLFELQVGRALRARWTNDGHAVYVTLADQLGAGSGRAA